VIESIPVMTFGDFLFEADFEPLEEQILCHVEATIFDPDSQLFMLFCKISTLSEEGEETLYSTTSVALVELEDFYWSVSRDFTVPEGSDYRIEFYGTFLMADDEEILYVGLHLAEFTYQNPS